MSVPKFFNWLREAGIECRSCGIHVFDGSGRGVIATTDILDGEVVVHVPDGAVLMPENCTISEVHICHNPPHMHSNTEFMESLHIRKQEWYIKTLNKMSAGAG